MSDSIFWLFSFTPRWRGWHNAFPKEGPKEICKERIETDKRRKHFFHTFLYLPGEWTNQRYVPAWCPKHQIVKSVLSVWRHCPKRGRFTENLSIYLSSPAPNSLLENPSNFGATASHWLLYILLFFFFLILTGWMRGALCVATRLYILYQAADESISGWEFLLIPKSPQSKVLL